MCKHSDMFSLAILIGRGLDHKDESQDLSVFGLLKFFFLLSLLSLFSFQGAWRLTLHLLNAPLAQLVEHLTLNQGVPGSSP